MGAEIHQTIKRHGNQNCLVLRLGLLLEEKAVIA